MKNADRVELMSLLGFFGAIISAIQMYPLSSLCLFLIRINPSSDGVLLLFLVKLIIHS